MKISLLHPSRGRPEKSRDTIMYWLDHQGKGNFDVDVVISVDRSDPKLDHYMRIYDAELSAHARICYYDNKSVVEATNNAAKYSIWDDILIYLSDDFKCPDNWAQLVIKEFENESRPLLLKVDDCLQKFEVPVLTIPIMNRELYERLGYFFHPEYKSMFVDEHLYWVSRKLNALKFAPHLKFEHQHVSVGKAVDDDTYRRSSANWDQGKALFAKHKAQGFPV